MSNQLPEWAIGPFRKYEKNPILSPTEKGWESWAVYNPAVIVKDDTFYMFYRAEDFSEYGTPHWGTSRIGLATSKDGLTWERYGNGPIIDATEPYELPGGCEDPRIVENDGTYYLTYTAYHYPEVMECMAVSEDLIHWRKLGPLFPEFEETKSGTIVCNPEGKAVRINGQYVMYLNNHMAYSEDLILWKAKKYNRGLTGEVCVALTDYAADSGDNILVFYGGSLKGEARDIRWNYAISESLYSKKDPEKLLAILDYPVVYPTEDYEKDTRRLMEGGAGGVLFMDCAIRHKGKWYLYYGASDCHIAVAVEDAK